MHDLVLKLIDGCLAERLPLKKQHFAYWNKWTAHLSQQLENLFDKYTKIVGLSEKSYTIYT